jgi:hypothetical protein
VTTERTLLRKGSRRDFRSNIEMNTASGFALYLVGSFVLVVVCLLTPAIRYYLGAFVIFLFMGGVFFAWLNTIRQTNKMIETTSTPPPQQQKKNEESKQKEVRGVQPSSSAEATAPQA